MVKILVIVILFLNMIMITFGVIMITKYLMRKNTFQNQS